MNALAVRPALASAAARRAGVQQATRSAVRVRAEETSTSGETEQAWVAYTAKNGERKTVSPAEVRQSCMDATICAAGSHI